MALPVAIAVFSLCSAGVVFLIYRARLGPQRRRVLAGGQVKETRVGPVEYATGGDGMPLLVVHGASGGYDQGLMIGWGLVGDRFRLVAPSRFGYLRTPLPADASPLMQADAHAALLEALRLPRAIVVGVSAGAPSAVQLAVRHPDRVAALILLSPLGYAPGPQAPVPGGRTSRIIMALARFGVDFGYWLMLSLRPASLVPLLGVPPALVRHAEPDDLHWVRQLLLSIQPVSWRMAGVQNDLAVRQSLRPDAEALERIRVPTLILACSDDLYQTLPAATFAAAHIRGASLVSYQTGGHLFVGHLSDVRREISAFLTGVPGGPTPPNAAS